ncbi:MAG: hypothetical protein ACXVBF_11555, partial [Flavisolibacter sp.]
MKAIKLTGLALLLTFACVAQDSFVSVSNSPDSPKPNTRRINFYVVNKPRTLDLYSRLVIVRAKHKAANRKEKFIVIVASSTNEVKTKIIDKLEEKKAMIGSLWFDSHGHYKNGYSSFIIGNEEFSYKTIGDTCVTKNLQALAPYCDTRTRVAMGSCYSGATYEKPAHKGKPAMRMNGDSLVIGLAHVLPGATVYGTEGWVMTKPGIFSTRGYALAGYPIQKRFKDEVYKPVWEHMGIWHSYSTETNIFTTENTLSL